jgi:hypothetical protein
MSPRKLSRKGKLDQDLPFREPKTFAIFPKCFGEREFYGYETVFQDSLERLERSVSFTRFIVHCTQNGRKKLFATSVCTILQASRPAASTRLLAQHEAQVRDGCRKIDAHDARRAVNADGIRCDRKSL